MAGMGFIQRSFYGGILILVILAVRAALLGRLPKRTFPILWVVVLLRLLLPVSFSSVFSIYSVLQPEQKAEVLTSLTQATYGIMDGTVMPDNLSAWTTIQKTVQNLASGENYPVTASASVGTGIFPILFIVWCIGAVLCAAWFGIAYFRSLWNFRDARPLENRHILQWLIEHKLGYFICVRQSDKISAPLTYGCFRPVILLPERLVWEDSQELEYVLQHEYVHICHCDAAVKLAMVAALCIHWFNPLVWLMSGLLNRDIELACDESVLHRFGEQSRAGYAMTLIGMEEKKRSLLPLYNGFSKNAIEERIRLIMKYKKVTYITSAAALLLVLAVVLVFATSAKQAEAAENSAISPKTGVNTGTDMEGTLMDPPKDSIASNMSNPQSISENKNNTLGSSSKDNNQSNIPESLSEVNSQNNIPESLSKDNNQNNTMESLSENKENQDETKSEYILPYMQEGLLQEEPADLFVGDGYCILIPKEGWQSYAPEAWMWEANEQVQFWVNDCSGSTWEQMTARLEEDGYRQTENNGILEKENDGRFFYAELKRSGFTLMCVNYTYPAEPEFIEGFGSFLRAISANFAIIPDKNDEELSEDGKQIKQLALAFWEAYLAGNPDAIKDFLAEDYNWDFDVFPDGIDGHVAGEAKVLDVKGLDVKGKSVGESLEIWVEFRPAAGADYLEYLTMTVIKEQEGWKVYSYGLEM